MAAVFLGLGANLGNRLVNLEQTTEALATLGRVCRSSWYETEPVDLPGAPGFLNGVVGLDTTGTPEELLDWIRDHEQRLGRDANRRNGSRPIDVDILLWGDEVIDRPGLSIPHPRMHERAFVLVPLAELAPDAVHPVLGKTAAELARSVDRRGVTRLSP
jgi:GTP cyclohydrolase-4